MEEPPQPQSLQPVPYKPKHWHPLLFGGILIIAVLLGGLIFLYWQNTPTETSQTSVATTTSQASDEITLTGRLEIEEYFGPPNYGENPDTDTKEYIPMLIFPQPTTIGTFVQISKVQLIVSTLDSQNFINKEVKVSGDLFEPENAHHHTPVLLMVKTIEISQ